MGKIDIAKSFDSVLLRIVDWAGTNKLKIAVFAFFSLLVVGMHYLPYFNLVFNEVLVTFLIIAIFILSFRLTWKATLFLSFSLLLISYLLTILRLISLADTIGNYIYGLLIIVAVGFFIAI